MGLTSLMTIVASVLHTGNTEYEVSPSIIQQIKSTKVDTQVIQTKKSNF